MGISSTWRWVYPVQFIELWISIWYILLEKLCPFSHLPRWLRPRCLWIHRLFDTPSCHAKMMQKMMENCVNHPLEIIFTQKIWESLAFSQGILLSWRYLNLWTAMPGRQKKKASHGKLWRWPQDFQPWAADRQNHFLQKRAEEVTLSSHSATERRNVRNWVCHSPTKASRNTSFHSHLSTAVQ